MKLAVIIASLAIGSADAWQSAAAAELGVYAAGYYGQASRDVPQQPFDDFATLVYQDFGFTPAQSTRTFDTEDSSYGFGVGYRLLRNLAVEGGYMDLGDLSYRDASAGTTLDGEPGNWRQHLDSGTSGITLSALGILPLTYRWELYVRGGVMFSSNQLDIFITDGEQRARSRGTQSGIDMLAGIGAAFSFAEIYAARFEFQRVFDAGESETGPEADVDILTIGLTVSF